VPLTSNLDVGSSYLRGSVGVCFPAGGYPQGPEETPNRQAMLPPRAALLDWNKNACKCLRVLLPDTCLALYPSSRCLLNLQAALNIADRHLRPFFVGPYRCQAVKLWPHQPMSAKRLSGGDLYMGYGTYSYCVLRRPTTVYRDHIPG
jgi:hypothetical protein